MAQPGSIEIHGYVNCPFAWRVRLAAAEKNVGADWIPCDVEDPDPRALAHNPDEHSPLLFHAGFSLLESEIIMLYVDELFPGRALVPTDPRTRAELRFLARRLEGLDVHTEPSRPHARRRSQAAQQALEAALETGPYLHGAEPGLSDLLIWPFVANLGVRGLLEGERSRAYLARAAARATFAQTAPPWAASAAV
jgi:glutathione S-transferase